MQKIIYIYQSHYASPLVYLIISVPFLEYLAFSLIWDTNTTLYNNYDIELVHTPYPSKQLTWLPKGEGI